MIPMNTTTVGSRAWNRKLCLDFRGSVTALYICAHAAAFQSYFNLEKQEEITRSCRD